MDILTHTLSGVAVATVAASFSKGSLKYKSLLLMCGAIGGVIPDVDAISLWSGFDPTIGGFLNLSYTGRQIYFSNFWYSHHNFTHSLMGAMIISMSLPAIVSILGSMIHSEKKHTSRTIGSYGLASAVLFSAYLIHLLGDLPTPNHIWGGIKLFWPSAQPIGGTGHVWWWNNYDIFLITFFYCAANLVIFVLLHFIKKPIVRYLPLLVFTGAMVLNIYQITHRNIDFNALKYNESQKQSLAIQKKILGKPLYQFIMQVDQRLPLYF